MSYVMKAIFVAILAVSYLVATPAQAQSKKELAAQNVALAERLSRLESRCLLYTSPSPRDQRGSRMPSSA